MRRPPCIRDFCFVFNNKKKICHFLRQWKWGLGLGECGQVVGDELRAAQQVERGKSSTGSGAPGLGIAPAQGGGSERMTSPPVLEAHPTGQPLSAFRALLWSHARVKRTTTAWFLEPWSLTLLSSALGGRKCLFVSFLACPTWEVTSRALRDGALPGIREGGLPEGADTADLVLENGAGRGRPGKARGDSTAGHRRSPTGRSLGRI